MTRKGMRLVVALALVAAMALVAPAGAAPGVASKLQLKKVSATGASGKLKSAKRKCVKRRKIELHWQGEYTPVRVARAKTDKKGRWKIKKNLKPGYYFASAPKVKRGKTVCKPAESKSLRLTG